MENKTINPELLSNRYNFFNDPGHGWLEVPRREIVLLGIADQITGFSYVNRDMVYLEEDQDMSTFVKAWFAAHRLDDTRESWQVFHKKKIDCYQERSMVRDMNHYC